MSAPELGPAVVIRAARFPVRALEALADPALVAAMIAGGTPAERLAAYQASAERQRRVLWTLTVEDACFVRALALTNEGLAQRVVDQPLRSARNKRARHLETTLYRYLARAVWRTEPCDLWAGMTLASWGEATRLVAQPARYAITPDLRPFQAMVQALARTEPYRTRGSFRLNPTLELRDQQWHYAVRGRNGVLTDCTRPNKPWLEASLAALRGITGATFETFAAVLLQRDVEPARAHEVLRALRDAGMLVGGLSFPMQLASAWDALRDVVPTLTETHARAWRWMFAKLRRRCLRLERAIETMPVAAIQDAQATVRAVIRELAAALDVPVPPLPRAVLRCDHRLPFDVVLGPDARDAIAQTVAEYDAFEATAGLDAAVRAAHRARLLEPELPIVAPRGVGAADPSTQEAAWLRAGGDAELGRRLAAWSRWITIGEAEASRDPAQALRLAPVAVTVLRPVPQGFAVLGSTPEVVPAYGRFGPLWREPGPHAALHDWYESRLAREARKARLEVVALVSPCEWAPNALARPASRFRAWEVGDASEGPLVVACFAPADVARAERELQRLLLTSFREVPTWISYSLPFNCELTRAAPAPQLSLASGNVVRARRTTIVGAELEALAAAQHEARFALWHALAERHGWPPLVVVSRDGGPPLLVVRDSLLAVEAALEGIGGGVSFVTIEEPDDQTWLADRDGQRYATELIVPFVRSEHAWSRLAAGERAAPEARGEP